MAGIHLLLIAATLAAATPHPQATSAGLQPPAGFLALDACVDWGDATCTLSELLGRGFPGARLSWSRSLLRYEGLDGPGEEVVWKVTIAPTTGRPVVLDLSRTCSERALEEGTVHLPVVEIDQVDGADSLTSGPGWKKVEAALKAASRPRPPVSAARGAAPPAALLDLEICATFGRVGCCTVRELTGQPALAAAQWRWLPTKERGLPGEHSLVEGWHLILPEEPDGAQRAIVFYEGCAYGHRTADLAEIGDFSGRPYVSSPPFEAPIHVRRVAKPCRWPPAE